MRWIRCCFLMIASLSLASCCCLQPSEQDPYDNYPADSTHLSAGATRQQIAAALMQNYPVKVFLIGDTLRVVLPSDVFIKRQTNQANAKMAPAYRLLAQLLQTYSGPILVAGHTDNVGTDESKLTRSFVQARSVSAFLWSNGIPLSRMHVIGCADWEPVATNQNVTGSAANRRIEILAG